MALKISKDHWAFLEEIEAPMWVDLNVEAKSEYQDIDDGWFFTSHLFHQCSSLQLKAAFAHSGKGDLSANYDLQEPSSPKLPSSVSRSRGKHYAAKKWGGDNQDLSPKKQQPVKILSGKSSSMSSGYGDYIKSKRNSVYSKGTKSSKISLVSARGFRRNARENGLGAISISGESKSHSSSKLNKGNESNASTITSESDHQTQQKKLDVSNGAFGQTSGILSTMRISLRKSNVTRQVSRVEIKNDSKQSRVSMPSTSNSSVGSSSNAAHDGRRYVSMLMQKTEDTPDSHVTKMTEAANNKVKDSTVSKACILQIKKQAYKTKRESMSNVTKSVKQEAGKSKDQNQALRAKALVPLRLYEKGSLTGAVRAKAITVNTSNRLVGVGKENAAGRVSKSQTFSKSLIVTGGMTSGWRKAQNNVLRKVDKTGLVDPQETISCPVKGKQSNPTRAVYFR